MFLLNLKTRYLNLILAAASGLLTGLAIYHISNWLIWIALVPFFLAVRESPIKKSLLYGFLFGIAEGSVLLYWIIEITQKYSGTSTLLGVPIFLVAVFYFAVFPSLFALGYYFLNKEKENRIYSILLTAFLWILVEWININLLPGIPWVKYSLGFTQSTSLYGLQLASITGQWGISLVIALVNIFFANALVNKKLKFVLVNITITICFYLTGFLMLNIQKTGETSQIKVSILQENIKAETRWQESNGDSLANVFFELNRQAAEMNPDIIVWSETALPWTFTPDDDLMKMALQITRETKAGHILGILSQSEHDSSKVYNSAYYIEPDGRITSRYDKVDLLSFLEEPLLNPALRIPFLSEGRYNNVLNGSGENTLTTTYCKIGVLICNESLLPYRSSEAVKMGADLLVNMSNDAWLEGTQLVDHHFHYARMRAVETGKSIIVNSNRGVSGIINGSGKIIKQNQSKKAACIGGYVTLTSNETFYSKIGDWLIYLGIIFIIIFLFTYKGE